MKIRSLTVTLSWPYCSL